MPSVRPTLHPLQTPKSAAFPRSAAYPSLKTPLTCRTPSSGVFPSELPRSPLPGGQIDLIKREDNLKTPITPPTAYTDFLKILASPTIVEATSDASGESKDDKSGKASPVSNKSNTSQSSITNSSSMTSGCPCSGETKPSPRFIIPLSPYTKSLPQSAPATGLVRRLRVPQSPLCSPGTDSPMSARSMRSPFGVLSPNEWDRSIMTADVPSPRTKRPVSVRQVVTRTVTYTPLMDLAPAPKGKKRRIE